MMRLIGLCLFVAGAELEKDKPPTLCHTKEQHQCIWVDGDSGWQK